MSAIGSSITERRLHFDYSMAGARELFASAMLPACVLSEGISLTLGDHVDAAVHDVMDPWDAGGECV